MGPQGAVGLRSHPRTFRKHLPLALLSPGNHVGRDTVSPTSDRRGNQGTEGLRSWLRKL